MIVVWKSAVDYAIQPSKVGAAAFFTTMSGGSPINTGREKLCSMAGPKVVSAVVVAVKNKGRVLLLGPDASGAWRFPSEEFDGELNGNMDSTIRRALGKIFPGISRTKCIGSFVAKRGDVVEAVYNFSADARGREVPEPHMWVAPDEMEGMELDFRTAAFLKAGRLVK